MRLWISATNSLASVVITAKVRIHSSGNRVFPIFPQSAEAKGTAVLHGDGVGLLGFLALDRLPLKEAIDGCLSPAPLRPQRRGSSDTSPVS